MVALQYSDVDWQFLWCYFQLSDSNLFNHIAKFCCSFDKLHLSFFCNFPENKKSCTTQIAIPYYPLIQKHVFIAEFWRPKGLPSGTLCSYRKEKETHEWIFTWLILSLASGIAPGHVCTMTAMVAALYDIGLSCHGQLTKCKNKVSPEQYHITILPSSSSEFIQVLSFFKLLDWIAGSCQVDLL